MQNQNQNTETGVSSGDPMLLGPSPVVLAPEINGPNSLSFDPDALAERQPVFSAQSVPAKESIFHSRVLRGAAFAGLALFLIGFVAFVIVSANRQHANVAQLGVASKYDTVAIPLENLKVTDTGVEFSTSSVVINGELRTNGGLIVAPSLQPTGAKSGQLYFDQGTKQLAYFNGVKFVSLSDQVQAPPVVEAIAGATGQLTVGGGIGVVGNQITNSGVLSVGGQTGAISVGSGLVMVGNTVQNTGVVSVASGSPTLFVANDGSGNLTLTTSPAGTGTVTSGGGTTGRVPLFTGAQNIEDSLISQSGLNVTVNGDLSVVTGGLSLSNALTVSNGGTGATSLAANGVIIGAGTGALTSVTAGGAGLCLLSTGGAPNFAACPSSSGVTSLNGLNGALSVANASGVGSTITIDDASTVAKGIASFNSTNFSTSSGAVNTVQNINAAATPTFAGVNTNTVTPSSTLTVGATGQALVLQGNGGTVLTATSGGNTTTVGFDAPGAAVTINVPALAAGTYAFCTTSGNCLGPVGSGANIALSNLSGVAINTTLLPGAAGGINLGSGTLPFGDLFLSGTSGTPGTNNFRITGASTSGTRTITLPDASGTVCITTGNCTGVGGGVSTAGGTIGTLPVFTAAQVLGDSLVSQAAGVVTVNGNLNLTAGNQYRINGTQIASGDLSNDANLAKLAASQTFTGNNNSFRNGSNSASAFSVQNAGGNGVLTVDTTGGQVLLGLASTLDGKVVFSNMSNANTVTILPGTPSAPRTITLPDASGIICTSSGNCAGAGATLQTAYNFSVGGTTPKIKLDSTLNGLEVQDADTTIGADLFTVRESNGAGLGQVMFGVGNTGQVTLQNGANSTAAFRLLTDGGTSVLTGDTQNGRIILGQSGTLTGVVLFNNSTNGNQLTLTTAAVTAPQTITLPNSTGTVCLTSGNCAGVGGTGDVLQNGNTFGTALTLGTNDAFDFNLERQGVTKVTVGANDVTLATDIDLLLQGMNSYISNPRNGLHSEAFGLGATTGNLADDSLSVGYNALSATGAVALGASASADTSASVAIGKGASTNGDSGAIALGYNTSTGGDSSIALGIDAVTTAAHQLVIGAASTNNYIDRVVVGSGVTSGTPTAFTLQATSGAGTDVQGADITIASGQGTGNATGGDIRFSVSTPGVSGGSLNLLSQVFGISGATGGAIFQNAVDSSVAFQIQNSASGALLTANTLTRTGGVAGNLLKVGDSTGTDTDTTILQLDGASADPTTNLASMNGGLYYNSSTHKVSLIENGAVKIICNTTDLGCGTGTVTLQSAYGNGSTISTTGNDIAFTLASSQSFTVATAAANTAGGVSFSSGNTSGTQTNGLLINRNGGGGITTNGINITQTAGTLTNGLAFTGTIGTDIQRSSGTLTVQGAGGVTITAGTTSAVTIDSAGAGTTSLGAANATTINIASSAPAAARSTTIGGGNAGFVDTINIGTGAGTVAGAKTIHIGDGTPTGSGTNLITIGSIVALANTTTIQGGNGAAAIAINTASGGTLNVGNGAVANTLQIGNTTGAVTQTINIGNNATASSTNNVTIGSTIAGTTAIQGATTITNRTSGSADTLIVSNSNSTGTIALFRDNATDVFTIADGGAITSQNQTDSATAFRVLNTSGAGSVPQFVVDTSNSRVYVGNPTGDTTGALLVLDTKTSSGDPTGVAGGMYYNSNTGQFRCYEANFWRDCIESVRTSYHYSNDFTGSSPDAVFDIDNSTSGSQGTLVGEQGHPGILTIQAATSAGTPEYMALVPRSSALHTLRFGNGDTWRYESVTRIATAGGGLSTAGNRYTYRVGFVDDVETSTNFGNGANGCFFRYSDNLNSGKWQGVCRNNTTESTCDSTTTVAVDTWYRLTVLVNSAGNSVDFQINGVSKCQVTTNIPTAVGRETNWGSSIYKNAGATSRVIDIDYIDILGQMGSSR